MTVKDLPDNYPWLPGSERYPIADLGELAARLGALSTFDRRGEVLFQSDFEYELGQFTTATSGTGAAVAAVSTPLYLGPKSIKLTGGSDGTRLARIFWHAAPVKENKWGLEVSVDFGSFVESFELCMRYYDGTNEYDALIKIVAADWSIQVEDNVAGWVTIGTFGFFGASGASFHTIKLVADFANKVYTRVIIGSREIDLSDYTLLLTGAPGEYNLFHRLTLVSLDTKNAIAHLGHIIVTGNEP